MSTNNSKVPTQQQQQHQQQRFNPNAANFQSSSTLLAGTTILAPPTNPNSHPGQHHGNHLQQIALSTVTALSGSGAGGNINSNNGVLNVQSQQQQSQLQHQQQQNIEAVSNRLGMHSDYHMSPFLVQAPPQQQNSAAPSGASHQYRIVHSRSEAYHVAQSGTFAAQVTGHTQPQALRTISSPPSQPPQPLELKMQQQQQQSQAIPLSSYPPQTRQMYRPQSAHRAASGGARPLLYPPSHSSIIVPYAPPANARLAYNQPQTSNPASMFTPNNPATQYQSMSYFYNQPYFPMNITNPRAATSTPAPIVQTTLAQPPMTIQAAVPTPVATPVTVDPGKKVRRKCAMEIINPDTGEDVLNQYYPGDESGVQGASNAASSSGTGSSNTTATTTNSSTSISTSTNNATLAQRTSHNEGPPSNNAPLVQQQQKEPHQLETLAISEPSSAESVSHSQKQAIIQQHLPPPQTHHIQHVQQQHHQQQPQQHHIHHIQQQQQQQHHAHHPHHNNHNRINPQMIGANTEYSTTPVVSANSDGPSVDIKQKKNKNPEIQQMPRKNQVTEIKRGSQTPTHMTQQPGQQHQAPHHQPQFPNVHSSNVKKPYHGTGDRHIPTAAEDNGNNQSAKVAIDYTSMESKDVAQSSVINENKLEQISNTTAAKQSEVTTTAIGHQQHQSQQNSQSSINESVSPYLLNNNKNNLQSNEIKDNVNANVAATSLNPVKPAFVPKQTTKFVNSHISTATTTTSTSTGAGNITSINSDTPITAAAVVAKTTNVTTTSPTKVIQMKPESDFANTETEKLDINNDKLSNSNINNNNYNNELNDKKLIKTPPSIDETDKSTIVNSKNNNNSSLIDSNSVNDFSLDNKLNNNNITETKLARPSTKSSTTTPSTTPISAASTTPTETVQDPLNQIQNKSDDFVIPKIDDITNTTKTMDSNFSKDLPSSIVNINNIDNSNLYINSNNNVREDDDKTINTTTSDSNKVNREQQQQTNKMESNSNSSVNNAIGNFETTSISTMETSSSTDNSSVTSTAASSPIDAATTAPAVQPPPAAPAAPTIEYDTEQWSPLNPSGKKFYSRDQLIKLRIVNEPSLVLDQPDLLNALKTLKPMQIPSKSGSTGGGMSSGSGNNHHNSYQNKSFDKSDNISIMPRFGNRNTYAKRSQGNPGSGSAGGNNSGMIANKLSQGNMSMSGMGSQNMGMNSLSGSNSNSLNRDGSSNKSQMIKMTLQLNEDIKLNISNNAWKPKHLVEEVVLSEEDRKSEELFKRLRSILNKLTPDNFNVLVNQVKSLQIDSVERLDGCINLVFEKAVSEPNFSVAYAQMCKEIGVIFVQTEDDAQKINFRTKLILRCQKEFGKHSSDNKTQSNETLKFEETDDEQRNDELRMQNEEKVRKLRHRAVGTVRFIGELYKIEMLNASIMFKCVQLLLSNEDEESLECLCKLLTTVGDKLENRNSNTPAFIKCFDTLLKIVQRKSSIKVSSRIRFMIQDLIDLKNNKWQPRRADLNPKTMTQIAREAETEMITSQLMNYHSQSSNSGGGSQSQSGGSNQSPSNSGSRNKDDRRGGGGNNNGNNNNANNNNGRGMINEEGWLTKQTLKKNFTIDSKKILNFSTTNNENETKLGSASIYQNFNRFAPLQETHTSSSTASSSASNSGTPGNKNKEPYHSKNSLESDRYHHHYDGRRSGGNIDMRSGNNNSRNNSRENSRSRSSMGNNMSSMSSRSLQPPASSNRGMHSQQHSNNQQNTAMNRDRDQQSGGASTSLIGLRSDGYSSLQAQAVNASMKSSAIAGSTPSVPQVSSSNVDPSANDEIELNKFVNASASIRGSTLDEFIQEFIGRFKALNPVNRWNGVYKLLECNIDHAESRKHTTLLIIEMLGQKIIKHEDLLKSLTQIIDMLYDTCLDHPRIMEYNGQVLAMLLIQTNLTFNEFKNCCTELVKNGLGQDLLKELFKHLIEEYGVSVLRDLWRKSKCEFSDFMDESAVPKFIEQNKFEFVNEEKYMPSGIQKISDINVIQSKLRDLLKSKLSVDSIFDWISTNVVPSMTSNKVFIRGYTRVVIENFIGKNNTFEPEPIDMFTFLLKKYIDNHIDRELQCLYEIQNIVYELQHPPQLLSNIFHHLYDEDIISKSSFNEWSKSDQEKEKEKGVALKSCTTFFLQMTETTTDSEDETGDENEK